MTCKQCNTDLETTIAFTTICCKEQICAECLIPRTGRCNDMSCDNIHYKCYFCNLVSNVPQHIFGFIALARGLSKT